MMNETKNEIPEALWLAQHLDDIEYALEIADLGVSKLLREQHEEIVRLREEVLALRGEIWELRSDLEAVNNR